MFVFAFLLSVAVGQSCPSTFARTGCVVVGTRFSCRNAEPWVQQIVDNFIPQDAGVMEKEPLLIKRMREVAVSPNTPGTLCCVSEENEILCEPPSLNVEECPQAGYLDTGCEVNQKNEIECVREADWLAELEHDLEKGNLAHAMMLERIQGSLHANPGSRCCLTGGKVFCEPPRAASNENCKSTCSIKEDLGGAEYKVVLGGILVFFFWKKLLKKKIKECREVCILAPGTPDKEGFKCKTRCSRKLNACRRLCFAVTSHSINLEQL